MPMLLEIFGTKQVYTDLGMKLWIMNHDNSVRRNNVSKEIQWRAWLMTSIGRAFGLIAWYEITTRAVRATKRKRLKHAGDLLFKPDLGRLAA